MCFPQYVYQSENVSLNFKFRFYFFLELFGPNVVKCKEKRKRI